MGVNVDQPRFALHVLPLTGQFVEADSILFDRRDHRRNLMKIAVE